jgi:hypothetical protein
MRKKFSSDTDVGVAGRSHKKRSDVVPNMTKSSGEKTPWWIDARPVGWSDPANCMAFITHREAVEHRGELIATLEAGDKASHDLARRLRACRPPERCGSTACPVCGRRFQRWLASEVLYDWHERDDEFYMNEGFHV